MENSKRSPKKAFIGSASSCQCLRRQEGVSRDASAALGNRANSVRPSGPSSSMACRQPSCHQMRWIDNDDLLASIDRHGQSLTECLSLVELALTMVRCRSPPAVDSVEDRLAKAEARIAGEILVITSTSFQFCLRDSDHLPFESFRSICPTGEPSISCGSCCGICQCQGRRSGGSFA